MVEAGIEMALRGSQCSEGQALGTGPGLPRTNGVHQAETGADVGKGTARLGKHCAWEGRQLSGARGSDVHGTVGGGRGHEPNLASDLFLCVSSL